MIIDLSNPIVIGVSISIISATILGIIHYVKTLIQLNLTNKKLSDIFSELETLNRNYKNEISNIKQRRSQDIIKAIDTAIDFYEEKMNKLIQDNRPALSEYKKVTFLKEN